jgi:hypothetical protein
VDDAVGRDRRGKRIDLQAKLKKTGLTPEMSPTTLQHDKSLAVCHENPLSQQFIVTTVADGNGGLRCEGLQKGRDLDESDKDLGLDPSHSYMKRPLH